MEDHGENGRIRCSFQEDHSGCFVKDLNQQGQRKGVSEGTIALIQVGGTEGLTQGSEAAG